MAASHEEKAMKLESKVAIITGVGPNIGRAVALGFAGEGARVACNHRRPEAAERTVKLIREAGGEAMAIPNDVTDEAGVEASVQRVLDEWGHVDVLVNNAAQINPKGVLDMSFGEFREQTASIIDGTFLWTKYVAKSMVDRGVRGSIINVVTCAAWQGEPGNVGYTTAKGGVVNFTRSVAMELARHGIRVNNMTPTATQPEDEEALERRRSRAGHPPTRDFTMDYDAIPLGRKPTPSDYVPAFLYLASDDSSMVTGTNLTVDGGVLAKYWPWYPEAASA